MTEQEAIQELENTPLMKMAKTATGASKLGDAVLTAVEALREIQRYRAIGTVEECQEAVARQNELRMWLEAYSDPVYESIIWTQPELNAALKEFLSKK